MKKFSFPLIVLLSITAMSSCRNKQAEVNPLLAPWDTPYEVPPFDKIEIRHYKPAVEQAIVRHQKEIDSIASNPAAPDFENTIAALDRSGETLDRVYTTFSLVAAADNNEAMQQADLEISPAVAAHRDDIYLNEKLFERVEAVYEKLDSLPLTPEQKRLLWRGNQYFHGLDEFFEYIDRELTAFGIKENDREEQKDKLSLKDMYHIFVRNDQLVAAGIASIFFNITCNILIIFGVNFFYIEYGYSESGNLVFYFTVMYGLGMLISQASYATLAKHFTRQKMLNVCFAALLIGYACFMGFGYVLPKNVVLLNAIGFVIFFFQGLMNLVIIVMINNTIEYDEARFHERHDSVISAVRSFSVKLAGGINQGLSTLVLIVSGIYAKSRSISALEIEVNRGEISSEAALAEANRYIGEITTAQGILFRVGMVLIPLIALAISYMIIRKKYHIDEAEYAKLVEKTRT